MAHVATRFRRDGDAAVTLPADGSSYSDPHALPDPAIRVRGLTKRYGSQVVLDGLNFDVPRGEITVFIGPSGTGKSVLMKSLVGLVRPDQGTILYGDQELGKLRGGSLYDLRARWGMLFQDGALFDSLTVYENIAFPMRRHTRWPEEQIRAVVADKLAAVGLPGIEAKMPAALSGGMRKRVGLARAIALDPDIVFFDEPQSGLDPVMSAAIDELILDIKARLGSTFVVISHDIEGTLRMADRIGMLWRGRLVRYDVAAVVREDDDPVLRQFFGRRTEGPIAVLS